MTFRLCYISNVAIAYGRLAQLVEYLPYKQRVIGSSPISPTIDCNLFIGTSCKQFNHLFSIWERSNEGNTFRVSFIEATSSPIKEFYECKTTKERKDVARGSGSVVERCLAKANVASSNLVFRSR